MHPDLRTVRKSLAKELVRLQEELDSLMNRMPEAPVVEESKAQLVENFTNDECLAGGADEEEKEATESLEISSPGDNSEKTPNFTEPSQGAQMMDTSAKAQGQDTSEPMSSDEDVEDKLENSTAGVQEKNDTVLHAADMGPALEEPKDEQENGSQDVEHPLIAENLLGDSNCDSHATKGIDGSEVGDIPQPINEGHLEINKLEELPVLIEEQTAMDSAPQLEKDDEIEAGSVEVQEACEIGKEANDVSMEDYGASKVNDQEQPPVDENPEEKAEAAPAEAEVSEGSQYECDGAAIITLNDDEAPGMNQSEEQLKEAETESRAGLLKERVSGTDKPQPVIPFVENEEDKGAADVEDAKDDPRKKAVPIEESQEESLEGGDEGFKTARVEAPGTESGGGAIDNQALIEGAIDNQARIDHTGIEADEKLIEENRKLREMMEQMMNAGKAHLTVISNLSRRVKDLERKLSRKKKLRSRRHRAAPPCPMLAVEP